jgi:hypothetical protein
MNLTSVAVAAIILSLAPTAIRADDSATPASPTAPAATKLHVRVIGRVKNPGTYTLDAGTRLSDALAAAGAEFDMLVARGAGPLVPDTDCALGGPGLRYVYLARTSETSKTIGYMIDIARQRDDARYDPLLRDGDGIFVPDCRPKGKYISTPPMAQDTAPGVRNARRSAGGLAQLVEHLHGMQGVRSSSLLSSTSPLR